MFEGIIVSAKMQNTVVVEVFRKKPHPLYKGFLKEARNLKLIRQDSL